MLDRVGELRRRRLGVLSRRPLDDPLQPFHEPALDIREERLDALHRVRFLALDPLAQLPLALPEPFVELVQRLAPLDRVYLEIGLGDRVRLLRRSLELLADLDERLLLRLAVRGESLGVGREPRLGVCDQPLLPNRQRAKLVRQRALRAREILAPLRETLLRTPLRFGEPVRKLGRRRALALRKRVPPLVGDPPLLLGEKRQGISSRTRQDVLQLA